MKINNVTLLYYYVKADQTSIIYYNTDVQPFTQVMSLYYNPNNHHRFNHL